MSYHIGTPYEIWKHVFDPNEAINNHDGIVKLDLPLGSQVTKFDIQGASFCIWEMHQVRERDNRVGHEFYFVGTGHPIPGWVLPIGEAMTAMDGLFVWHLVPMSDQRNNMEDLSGTRKD